jgi:hypothetical protein
MLFGKGTKPLPIRDPWLAACLGIHLGSEAAGRRFTLEPQVDGVTTDAKDATGFALPHPIPFDGVFDASGLRHPVDQPLQSPPLPGDREYSCCGQLALLPRHLMLLD